MPQVPTVIASWTRTMLLCAAEEGISTTAVLHSVGLQPGVLEQPDARIPSRLDGILWEWTARRASPAFGLRVATRFVRETTFGVVGFIVASSASLHDSFVHLAELQALVSNDGSFTYRVDDASGVGEAIIIPSVQRGRLPPDMAEALIAGMLVLARACTGNEIIPCEVRLQHALPRHAAKLLAFFGVQVSFNSPDNALVLPREALALPMRCGVPEVCRYLREVARTQLRALPTEMDFAAEVRSVIAQAIEAQDLGLAQVARRMGLGSRSLQRRLQRHGLAYQGLVESVRAELAQQMLAASDVSSRAIATQLGFARRSAFRRAFRRWTGQTPRSFRSKARSGVPPTEPA